MALTRGAISPPIVNFRACRFRSGALIADLDKDDLITRCETLSPREADVLRRWVYQSAKEIALEWKIGEYTVRGYANEARQKLGVVSTRKAARLFQEYEAIKSPPQNWGINFCGFPIRPAVSTPARVVVRWR